MIPRLGNTIRVGHFLMTLLAVVLIIIIGRGTSPAADTVQSLLPRKALSEGWTLIEGPKLFNKKTLFQHINGQAELFLKYGYRTSAFGVYQSKGNHESQVDLDIYDMENTLQAFGIFSRFRMEDRPGGFGSDSYSDERSAYFYQGTFFVLLQATDPNSDLLKQWATAISKRIRVPSSPPREIGYFPPGNLKPGSIQYFSESLLGLQFLRRGFQGTYVYGGKESSLFLAVFGSPGEAIKAGGAFKNYLSSKGKIFPEAPAGFGPNAFKGEDPYKGKIIAFQQRNYLVGAAGFQKEEEAENLLAEVLKNTR